MYLLVYINKTSNMAIAEYGFYNYIEKRRAFLGEQDDIIGLMKISLGWRDYFKCLFKKSFYEKIEKEG